MMLAVILPLLLNDGGLSLGGNPTLLKGHPSVSMVSEKIVMTVSKDKLTTTCDFTFKNSGKKTEVRMGFPDRAYGERSNDSEFDPATIKKKPPKASFLTFESWVSGKKVNTDLVRGDKPDELWHTKMVPFSADKTLIVKDVYTNYLDSQITKVGVVSQVAYVLHTGASWKGKISRGEFRLQFAKEFAKEIKKIKRLQFDPKADVYDEIDKSGVGVLSYRGPSKAIWDGDTLVFKVRNYEPTKADDIFVFFHYHTFKPSSEKSGVAEPKTTSVNLNRATSRSKRR